MFRPWIDAVESALRGSRILDTIQYHQRRLDPFDIEGLVKLWDEEMASGVGFGSNLADEVQLEDWEEFVRIDSKTPYEYQGPEGPGMTMSKLRFYLLAYLLSAMLKDCSIMIRFSPKQDPQVTVIDLDPKPLGRMRGWAQKDRDVITAFLQSDGLSSPYCDDAGHALRHQNLDTRI